MDVRYIRNDDNVTLITQAIVETHDLECETVHAKPRDWREDGKYRIFDVRAYVRWTLTADARVTLRDALPKDTEIRWNYGDSCRSWGSVSVPSLWVETMLDFTPEMRGVKRALQRARYEAAIETANRRAEWSRDSDEVKNEALRDMQRRVDAMVKRINDEAWKRCEHLCNPSRVKWDDAPEGSERAKAQDALHTAHIALDAVRAMYREAQDRVFEAKRAELREHITTINADDGDVIVLYLRDRILAELDDAKPAMPAPMMI